MARTIHPGFPRAPLALSAWVLERDDRIAVSTTLERRAAHAHAPAPWKPRAHLDVILRRPHDARGQELSLRCVVVWCGDKELGAEFIGVDEAACALIDAAVSLAQDEMRSFAEAPTPLATHSLPARLASEKGGAS